MQSGSHTPDWDELARYLAGESAAAEAARIRAWLEAHPQDAALVQSLEEALEPLEHAPSAAPVDVEAALQRVRRRAAGRAPLAAVDAEPVVGPGVIPFRRVERRPEPWRRRGMAIAATLAALAVGTLFWQQAGPAGGPSVAARTYTTMAGQLDTIALPDGSTVLLGPGSELVLAAGYNEHAREMELRGQAYFTVRHADARPFSVITNGAVVRDLGTAFSVRTRDGDGVSVAVTEGSVLLRARAQTEREGVVLAAGDVALLAADATIETRRGGAHADELAWTRGQLVLRDAPLAEVRTQLRRWYGVELRIDDDRLAGRHVTATFERESRAEALQILALALGAEVELRGDTAVLGGSREHPQ